MNAVPLDRRLPGGWRIRLTQHRRAAADALGRLRMQPAGTLLTVLVLAVALLLPLLLATGLHNVRRLAGALADSGQIHLYLQADTPMPQAEALAEKPEAKASKTDLLVLKKALENCAESIGRVNREFIAVEARLQSDCRTVLTLVLR